MTKTITLKLVGRVYMNTYYLYLCLAYVEKHAVNKKRNSKKIRFTASSKPKKGFRKHYLSKPGIFLLHSWRKRKNNAGSYMYSSMEEFLLPFWRMKKKLISPVYVRVEYI